MKTHALALAASSALATPRAVMLPRVAPRPRAVAGFRPRADGQNATQILAQLQSDFAAFKEANDAALAGKADVVAEEKVQRINDSVTELQSSIDEMNKVIAALKLNGSGMGGMTAAEMLRAGRTTEQLAYKERFEAAFRRGNVSDADLHSLAVKAAMSTQSDPDGGWMVPVDVDREISRVLMTTSAMRGLAQIMTISTLQYEKLVSQGGASTGWVGETDARGTTTNPQLAKIAIEAMEIYAQPYATQTLLDDAFVDVGAWLADEVSISFAEQEGLAFITGNGVKKPSGIQRYTAVADNTYVWGKIGYAGTGGAAFKADPGGLDTLESSLYLLKGGYRANAAWMMNRKTIGVVRQMKDSQGHYQWQPSQQLGEPALLLGYPVADDDNMDDLGANKFPVAVADWKRAYLIVDRIGTRVLRDPYTNKPYVQFYTTKRVGGGVQNFEALKLIKCA
jgi:HK97 family phage major capsid protein